MLSTLDWALIETWQEADVPLAAVLRGIDAAFDKYDARRATPKARVRRVNGLAWCAQAVAQAIEEMQEAAIGGSPVISGPQQAEPPGLERERVAAHLESCAASLNSAMLPGAAQDSATELARCLRDLAEQARTVALDLESLDRKLSVLEEKLLASLLSNTSEGDLFELREEAARQLAPYRSRMKTEQIRQIERQFLNKRLFEKYNLPRLSLFYMS